MEKPFLSLCLFFSVALITHDATNSVNPSILYILKWYFDQNDQKNNSLFALDFKTMLAKD